jgi:hypothetical protein
MTILAKKAICEVPMATDDVAMTQLYADPSIPQFQNQYGQPAPVLTASAESNSASNAEVLVKADEHWINKHWRPAMGWLYMTTCAFDFILFPILWGVVQAMTHAKLEQWQPLTLQGAGLYHLAMGAILGVAAYGRTKEKMSGTL